MAIELAKNLRVARRSLLRSLRSLATVLLPATLVFGLMTPQPVSASVRTPWTQIHQSASLPKLHVGIGIPKSSPRQLRSAKHALGPHFVEPVTQNDLIWVAIGSLDEVQMVNQATGAVYGTPIPVGNDPESLCYWQPSAGTTDTNQDPIVVVGNKAADSVTFVNTVTKQTKTVSLGGSGTSVTSVACSTTTDFAVAVDLNSTNHARFNVINVATQSVLTTNRLVPTPSTAGAVTQIAFDSAGHYVVGVSPTQHKIFAISDVGGTNPFTYAASDTLSIPTSLTMVGVSTDPTGSSGNKMLVTTANTSGTNVWAGVSDPPSTSSLTAVSSLSNGVPGNVLLGAGGQMAYVAIPTAARVDAVDLVTTARPNYSAIAPGVTTAGVLALDWNSSTLFVGDTTTGTGTMKILGSATQAVNAMASLAGPVSAIATPATVTITFDVFALSPTLGAVAVMDSLTGNVLGFFSDAHNPEAAVPSPDGRRLYVIDQTGSGTGGTSPQVEVFNTSAIGNSVNGLIATYPILQSGSTPYSYSLSNLPVLGASAISPDGASLLISDTANSCVLTMDMSSTDGVAWLGKIVSKALLNGSTPETGKSISVAPDGSFAYVADQASGGGGISVLTVGATSTSGYGISGTTPVQFQAASSLSGVLSSGSSVTLHTPLAVNAAPDGRSIFVLDSYAIQPTLLNLPLNTDGSVGSSSATQMWSFLAGTQPTGFTLSPGAAVAYVTDSATNATYALNLSSADYYSTPSATTEGNQVVATPDGQYFATVDNVTGSYTGSVSTSSASDGSPVARNYLFQQISALAVSPVSSSVSDSSSVLLDGQIGWGELTASGSNALESAAASMVDTALGGLPSNATGMSASVNTNIRSYSLDLSAMEVPAVGLPLSVSATYDSAWTEYGVDSSSALPSFAYGWRLSTGITYKQTPFNASVFPCQIQLTQENGALAIFNPVVRGPYATACPAVTTGYEPAPWVQASLSWKTGCLGTDSCLDITSALTGEHTWIDATLSTHPVIKRYDRNGNTVTYTYTSGALTSMQSIQGGSAVRTITFTTPSPGTGRCPSSFNGTSVGKCLVATSPAGNTSTFVLVGSSISGYDLVALVRAPASGGSGPTSTSAFGYSSHFLTNVWSPTNWAATGNSAVESTSITYNFIHWPTAITAPQVTNEGTSMTDTYAATTTFFYPSVDLYGGSSTVVVADPIANWNVAHPTAMLPGANIVLDRYIDFALSSRVDGFGPAEAINPNTKAAVVATTLRDPLTQLPDETINPLADTTILVPNGSGGTTPVFNSGLTFLIRDLFGNVLSSSTPGSQAETWNTTTTTYNKFNEPLVTVDPLGNTTTDTYDANGNLLTESSPATEPWVSQSIRSFAYNANGTTCASLSANGHAAGYSLTSCPSSSSPYVTRYGYNSAGDQTSVIDPLGDTSTSFMNADGQLCASLSPDGYATGARLPGSCPTSGASYESVETGFTVFGSPSVTISPTNVTNASGGVTTTSCFDAGGDTIATLLPMGGTASCSTITSTTTALYTSYQSFNQMGESVASISPTSISGTQGPTSTSFFDPAGTSVANVAPGGNVSGGTPSNYKYTSEHDNLGNTTQSQDPSGSTSTQSATFDAEGNQLSSTSPVPAGQSSGVEVDTTTDPAGNVVATSSLPSTGSTPVVDASTFDANGNVVTTGSSAANAGGTLKPGTASTVTPSGAQCWSSTLPVSGTLSCATPPTGSSSAATTTYYDADGNKIAVTGPSGTPYQATGSPSGCNPLVTSTCADTTYYSFDQADRLVATIRPADPSGANPTTTNYYDAGGNVVAVTGPSGNPSTCNPLTTGGCAGTVYSTVDGSSRVTLLTYTDGTPQVATSYNADGTKASVVQGTGGSANTSSYSYDPVGRLLIVTAGSGAVTSYAYDGVGQLVCLSYPIATATCESNTASDLGQTGLLVRHYNNLGQMDSQTDWLGNTLYFTYDATGSLCATSTSSMSSCTASPTGVATIQRFDQAGQLAGATTVNSSTQLFDLTYTRDNNGNLASSTPTVGTTTGPVDSFNYTQQAQISSGPSTTGSSPTPYAYTQDHGITQAPGFGAAKYSASGQLCWTNATSSSNPCGTPPSGATAYGYDASGDRLSGGATNTLGWHQESSQLCYSAMSGSGTCAAPPSGASTYSYDSTGRRTSETVGFWTGTFTWDQAQTSLLSDGTASFLYGPSGSAPIEQITGSGAGAVADLLISDQIGNTRGLVRISGSTLVGVLTNTTDYDAYGNAIRAQGQAAEPGGVTVAETALNTNYVDSTPFGYGSGYTDPSGLVYLVHRYYDPTTGQFVSQDPLVDQTASPYGYAGGNPVGGVDPLGLNTLGYCLSSQMTLVGVSFGGGACLNRTRDAPDPRDDIGLTWTLNLAGGPIVGLGAPGVSVGIEVSNAHYLTDLKGFFWFAMYAFGSFQMVVFSNLAPPGKKLIYGVAFSLAVEPGGGTYGAAVGTSFTVLTKFNSPLVANPARWLWDGLNHANPLDIVGGEKGALRSGATHLKDIHK